MTPATVREAMPSQDDIETEWMRLPSFVRNKWGAVITNIVWMARRQERAAVLAAADAGGTEGPYTVTHHPETVGQYECWQVHEKDHEAFPWQECAVVFFAEPEARAVCNALTRVAARERGVG